MSLNALQRRALQDIARGFTQVGPGCETTRSTARALQQRGLVRVVSKLSTCERKGWTFDAYITDAGRALLAELEAA